jgi:hypothetical protein
MHRRCTVILGGLALLLSGYTPLKAASIEVNEQATRLELANGNALLRLAVSNGTGVEQKASIEIKLLSPKDEVKAFTTANPTISTGASSITISIPLSIQGMKPSESKEIPFYRIDYRLTPKDRALKPVNGIVALGGASPDVFALQVAGTELYGSGLHYRALVRAVNPVMPQGVAGAHVEGKLDFLSRPDAPLRAEATTDAQGYATLIFSSPIDIQAEQATLRLEAVKGDFRLTLHEEVSIARSVDVVVSTDKPLYQPGQVLHARVAIFVNSRDPARRSSRIALANAHVTLAVDNEEQTTVFQTKLQTSRFGVVHADWAIPDNQRLGDYMVKVLIDDMDDTSPRGVSAVRVSRYELPQFTVEVKPDRTYYLPGQDAELEVSAHYLFGKPVPGGSVRVVREVERRWNYREQKWDIEFGPHYEGQANSEGVLRLHVPLRHEFKEYLNEYSRFYDLSYAAYYTDPSTRRTEQRRFDLRITRNAIHVYAYGEGERLPLVIYVSTTYADGAPARCKLTVKKTKPQNGEAGRHAAVGTVLATATTNQYGLAKITGIAEENEGDQITLAFEAKDGHGGLGTDTQDFWRERDRIPEIRVETNKALFRGGEPIGVLVKSDQGELPVVVDAVRQARVLYSQEVVLHDGMAKLEIPADERFRDEVRVVAYPLGHTLRLDAYEVMRLPGSRSVLFPHVEDFNLTVASGRDVYKPGEEASAAFTLQAAGTEPVAGDLGVVVFDKAVRERARADSAFDSRFGGFAGDWDDGDSIAGITMHDLGHWDWTKPLPDGLDLLAEVLLDRRNWMYRPAIFTVNPYDADLREKFAAVLDAQLGPAKAALDSTYSRNEAYPHNDEQLAEMLRAAGIHFSELHDPWGTPFVTKFSTEATADDMDIVSTGPDKKPGTADDFVVLTVKRPYFRPWGEAIDHVAHSYHARTGGYIRDYATLTRELALQGIDLPKLRDPWGHSYTVGFDVQGSFYVIRVNTWGPRGKSFRDDLGSQLWASLTDYFVDTRSRIDAALESYTTASSHFPQDESTFREALRRAGIDWDSLRDPWGHPYFVTFETHSKYSDRRSVSSRAEPAGGATQKTTIIPVTQRVATIAIHSHGAKKHAETEILLAEFHHTISEQSGRELSSHPVPSTTFSASRGAIRGVVSDQAGAVIPEATVVATSAAGGKTYTTKCTPEGSFLLRDLPPGSYTLNVTQPGFRALEISDVWVSAGSETDVAVTLAVGTPMQMVMVSAMAPGLQTTSAEVATRGALPEKAKQVGGGGGGGRLATPRLREYFPETLYWQPDLEVGANGSATVRFKLADSITTWDLAAIASTEDGELAMAEKGIRAFQPFFVEHDPPPVLTVGDQIHLRVTVRNFLDKSQSVDVQIKPEEWFKPLGELEHTVKVGAGESGNVIFPFQALTPVQEGKHRVTAVSADASDAIERKVLVRPDGEDASATAAGIIRANGRLSLKIPEATIPGTLRAELKIYPNLMSHVVEALQSMQEIPVGCGEQIISAAYPSLLLLRYGRQTGEVSAQQAARARRKLELAYSQLVSLQTEDGGITYWGRGQADVALTAYALRFLYQASTYIGTDPDVLDNARSWLIKQEKADGRWAALDWNHTENLRRTALLTAVVVRALADAPPRPAKADDKSAAESAAAAAKALEKGFAYLDRRSQEIGEPYLIASHALAAIEMGKKQAAQKEVARLRAMSHEEDSGAYWALETNTPFYGWGTAGRLETTALVVEALVRYGEISPEDSSDRALIDRGLWFLIRGKDRFGLWYSTQATSNVLEALSLLSLSPASNSGAPIGPEDPAKTAEVFEVRVNGKVVSTVNASPGVSLNAIPVDVLAGLSVGDNDIEIVPKSGQPASAQVVAEYYLPWKQPAKDGASAMAGGSSGLRLAVHYDSPQTTQGTEVKCSVEAERVGFAGYGMLLGEIGLPPGAEVDRASLDRAMESSGWALERYDILPDRLLVYLWPTAAGSKFVFSFRLRYGINAQTARSVLYDYYNPEARVVVPPTLFVVR